MADKSPLWARCLQFRSDASTAWSTI